jgi:hypothetical protein
MHGECGACQWRMHSFATTGLVGVDATAGAALAKGAGGGSGG